MRREEIFGLAEKRLSSEYKRKDLRQFAEGSPSNIKARIFQKDIGVHAPVRKKKGKRRKYCLVLVFAAADAFCVGRSE